MNSVGGEKWEGRCIIQYYSWDSSG